MSVDSTDKLSIIIFPDIFGLVEWMFQQDAEKLIKNTII